MVAVGNSVIPGTIATHNANQQTEVSHISLPHQEVRRAGIRPLAPGNSALTGVLASHPEQCNAYEHRAVHIGLNPLSVDSESQYVAAGAQYQDQNSLGSTSLDRDAAMQTLLAGAYSEFNLDDVDTSVLRSCSAVPYGHCARAVPCAKTRYKMYMARMWTHAFRTMMVAALAPARGG